jgi:hypothetical protein
MQRESGLPSDGDYFSIGCVKSLWARSRTATTTTLFDQPPAHPIAQKEKPRFDPGLLGCG